MVEITIRILRFHDVAYYGSLREVPLYASKHQTPFHRTPPSLYTIDARKASSIRALASTVRPPLRSMPLVAPVKGCIGSGRLVLYVSKVGSMSP